MAQSSSILSNRLAVFGVLGLGALTLAAAALYLRRGHPDEEADFGDYLGQVAVIGKLKTI